MIKWDAQTPNILSLFHKFKNVNVMIQEHADNI